MACEIEQTQQMQISDADLERAPCPHNCGGGDTLLHTFGRFQINRCNDCGLVRLDPRLSESQLNAIYEQDYFHGHNAIGYEEYQLNQAQHERTAAQRLEIIRRHKTTGRLLDIGCGFGYFLNVAARQGFDVYGIDMSAYAIADCKSRFNGKVQAGSLEPGLFADDMFDVITMFDLFEHVYHPQTFLSIISKITKPDGIVVITTPNQRSLLSRVSGRRWVSYKIPEHIYFYTPQTLRVMSEPFFTVESVESAGQFCSLQFLGDRLKALSRPLGQSVLWMVNALGIKDWVLYANSGSMTVVLRRIANEG